MKPLPALLDRLAGRDQARNIITLALVLAVNSADQGAIGALAPQLEASFRISNVDIGLLVTVSSLVGAAATIPFGVLVDRHARTRLLVLGVGLWGVAELVSAASWSYDSLLVVRVGLGVVSAVSGPAVASLTGDLFPGARRGRVYGYILTGELLGSGAGLLIAGDVGAATSWRVGFALLGLPSLGLAWWIRARLPEPPRGTETGQPDGEAAGGRSRSSLMTLVREGGAEPDPGVVVSLQGRTPTMADALRWVIRARTNVLLIVASCLGYFFFAGLKTFAVLFVRGRFGVSEQVATLLGVCVGAAAIAGILTSGRVADRRLSHGRVDARLTVAAAGYLLASVLLVPALMTSTLAIALPIVIVAGAAAASPNSPLDAARLDVVPHCMWGRTEAVRSFLRAILESAAPLTFGFVSEQFGGGSSSGLSGSTTSSSAHVSAAAAQGIGYAFMVMLVPLAASGLLLLIGRGRYPVDVASAADVDAGSACAA